jgi:hypothetical protein
LFPKDDPVYLLDARPAIFVRLVVEHFDQIFHFDAHLARLSRTRKSESVREVKLQDLEEMFLLDEPSQPSEQAESNEGSADLQEKEHNDLAKREALMNQIQVILSERKSKENIPIHEELCFEDSVKLFAFTEMRDSEKMFLSTLQNLIDNFLLRLRILVADQELDFYFSALQLIFQLHTQFYNLLCQLPEEPASFHRIPEVFLSEASNFLDEYSAYNDSCFVADEKLREIRSNPKFAEQVRLIEGEILNSFDLGETPNISILLLKPLSRIDKYGVFCDTAGKFLTNNKEPFSEMKEVTRKIQNSIA